MNEADRNDFMARPKWRCRIDGWAIPKNIPPPLDGGSLIDGTQLTPGFVLAVSSPYPGDGKTSITMALGWSYAAAGHKTLVPQLIDALKVEGAGNIVVICGGVIPQQDYAFLKGKGVAAIFGPGTNIPQAAGEILGLIRRRRREAA